MTDAAPDPSLRDALLAAQDAERGRIARELHDELGQLLTSLRLSLSELAATLDTPQQQDLATDLDALSAQALQTVRDLTHELLPPQLAQTGLAAALDALCQRHDARSHVQCTLAAPDDLPRLPDALELAAYRIAQEALTNALRHARARHIRIALHARADTLQLTIEDDGAGYDTAADAGFGRRAMRERATQLHGTLEETSSERGTCVHARFPLI